MPRMMTSRARVGLILPSLVVLAALALAAPRELPQAPTAESIAAASVRAAGPLDKLLHKQAETVYRALSARFQPSRAMEVVTFMDRYWRLAGNPGFDATIDHLKAGLTEAGFREGQAPGSLAITELLAAAAGRRLALEARGALLGTRGEGQVCGLERDSAQARLTFLENLLHAKPGEGIAQREVDR